MAKKAAKKKSKASGCNCMHLVKDELAKRGASLKRHLQMNFATGTASMSPPSLVVEKIAGAKGKLPTVFCAHCPFCGKKY